MRKKVKSSSGDTSPLHPYMICLLGQEVTTAKIDRSVKPFKITIIKKVV
jgi:hypothetical protein